MTPELDERSTWFKREVIPHESALRAYAKRFCKPGTSEVDDLVHETFLKILTYPEWRTLSNPAAFAMTTLRNIALNELRRRKIVSMNTYADLDAVAGSDPFPKPDRILESRDELEMFARLLDELPPQCRKVFVLRKIRGLSHAEIGEALGISVSTIENHITKALRFCAARMGDQPQPGSRQPAEKARRWFRKESE